MMSREQYIQLTTKTYIQRNDVAGNLRTAPNPWNRLEESVAFNIPTTSYPHK